jgi:CheY-like chemotaxis protein
VDDNQTNRAILTKQANLWGMTPQAVTSGPEALTLLRKGISFDVAVLDMHMPQMDGLTLATEIRQLRSKNELPLVMLSSVGNREGHAAEKHFSTFLTKPVKPQQLYNSLMRLFGDTAVPKKQVSRTLQIDPEMGQHHPLRILLAEDNLVNQKVAQRILERMGYRADVAADGLEALEALQRQPYDVILMDVQMPNMDGVETTEQIRDIWPPEQQPRIIAMTAHALTGDREKYLDLGMDDYISKPVRFQDLLRALANSQPIQK